MSYLSDEPRLVQGTEGTCVHLEPGRIEAALYSLCGDAEQVIVPVWQMLPARPKFSKSLQLAGRGNAFPLKQGRCHLSSVHTATRRACQTVVPSTPMSHCNAILGTDANYISSI